MMKEAEKWKLLAALAKSSVEAEKLIAEVTSLLASMLKDIEAVHNPSSVFDASE